MLRGLLSHKLRLLLSSLAIVLGTMFMSAAFVGGDTIAAGFSNLFTTINQNIDVQVTAKQNAAADSTNVISTFVPQSVADAVGKVDGVRTSTPQVNSDGARVIDKKGKVVPTTGAPRFGIGWTDGGLAQIRQGAAPTTPSQIAISANLAKTTGFVVGDTVDVITLEPRQSFTLVGIFGYEGDRDSLAGETSVAFTMPTAQKLMLGKPDVYTSVDLTAADGVSPDQLKQRVVAVAGPDYDVKTGDEAAKDQASATSGFTDILKTALTVFAVIGMITGAFLIFNTFSMLVAQRTRELALYRSFGASKGQVNRAVLAESLLLGLASSLIGLIIGIGLGYLLKQLLQSFANTDLPVSGVVIKPYVVIVTLLVGTFFTVVAALVPALRAAQVPPIAAMREASTPDKSLRTMSIIGGVLFALGVLLLVLKMTKAIDGQLWLSVGGGALLAFIGAVMLAPLLTRPITRALGAVFSGSVAGRLGARNTGRNPRRTAITAAALMIGVTLATAAGIFAWSAKAGLTEAFTSDVKAQLIVSGGFSGGFTAGFDPALQTQIRAIPGVRQAAAVRADVAKVGGADAQILSGDPVAMQELFTLKPQSGTIRPLTKGEIILDSDTAKRLDATVGGTVDIITARGGPQTEKVVAILQPNTVVQGSPLLNPDDAAGFSSPVAQQAYVEVADGASVDDVKAQLEKLFADNPELTVTSQEEQLSQITTFLNVLLAIIWVLLGLAILVAVLGVINTLLLSIYERTREIGLIRAIGLSRGQTSWMVTVESVLISVFGALLGVVLGAFIGLALIKILDTDFLKLTVPWGYLLITLILAIVTGVIAAILPAIRASRLNVLDAIAYE
ncbi:putative ABC transport system permease protein [Allocatelliglobosispora scoriae]|uniref:Putative ABC transport system permease protein n=1 Tax=Allocatelliglobosispora scoriae TaxID=643052 RepID=A0A841C3X6_9ACTN|nr:FtsX-like permease family protein [Allocatelliglobosispora scoriae]MBB5873843.1 putative ABC transport system permease protein [Allocatelliglobosispora scoriae]